MLPALHLFFLSFWSLEFWMEMDDQSWFFLPSQLFPFNLFGKRNCSYRYTHVSWCSNGNNFPWKNQNSLNCRVVCVFRLNLNHCKVVLLPGHIVSIRATAKCIMNCVYELTRFLFLLQRFPLHDGRILSFSLIFQIMCWIERSPPYGVRLLSEPI